MNHKQIKGKSPGFVRIKRRGTSEVEKNKERWGRGSDEGQMGSCQPQSLSAVMLEDVSYKTRVMVSLSLPLTHTLHLRLLLMVGSIVYVCLSSHTNTQPSLLYSKCYALI